MTGKGSRDKGARGERQARELLEKMGFQGLRRGNVFAGDADVVGLWPFHLEIKRYEKMTAKKLSDACEQSIREMRKKKDGKIPVVLYKEDYKPFCLTIPEEWSEEVLRAMVWYLDQWDAPEKADFPGKITFPEEWIEFVLKAVVWYTMKDD